tara:strand:- start:737 stop:1513 length:777 start_codon:yes stop_codon:yes gene_type:complete
VFNIGFGALIGSILGFVLSKGRIFGAIIGYFIGSAFDRVRVTGTSSDQSGRSYRQYDANYYTSRLSQNDFATALLILSAAVMKADGKILKSELEYVKQFFKQQFSNQLASKYISEFKNILQKDFNISEVCQTISSVMPIQQRLLLIQYLFGIAQADGHVSSKEVELINRISNFFKISDGEFNQFKSMFYKDAANAFKVLAISKDSTNDEVKKAYRKMAIKHHPDKFSQLGEEQQLAAKEKFQKIQEAYETIKKERGFK